jgi:hypothetical protein
MFELVRWNFHASAADRLGAPASEEGSMIYYFHLCDGTDVLLDPEGRSLPDMNAVIALSLVEARAIIGAEALQGKIALEQRIEVEDELGAIVHTLPFEDAVRVTRAERL